MKSNFVDVINIRRQVFSRIAKMAYDDEDLKNLYEITYELLPGEVATYRENIYRERAIIGERLRLALGLDARSAADSGPITEGIKDIDVDKRIYRAPLVSVIKNACEACPERHIFITNGCRTCLAHPCENECPVAAISKIDGKMVIDQTKCIKCGKCMSVCPYKAIIETGRPCSAVCGVKAIGSDELNRACIDEDKCVSCGACITACPFGAIADKSQIYQLIKSIKNNDNVYGIVAPSFAGQFGPLVTPEQVKEAIKMLGFQNVIEVGLGADLTTMNEAKEFLESVPAHRPFMGTSCCYSWKLLVNKNYPELTENISDTSTPMIYTAQQIKKKDPTAKVVFIGPCISKKLEALQETVKDYVDFVITYEELMGLFVAKDIEPSSIEVTDTLADASATGREYAIGGGVATAVIKRAQEINPDITIEVEHAEGLPACMALMKMAKQGRTKGKLLEGMACVDGCVGGPGTIVPSVRSRRAVQTFAKKSPFKSPADNDKIPDVDKP